jgi:hypothetical protein
MVIHTTQNLRRSVMSKFDYPDPACDPDYCDGLEAPELDEDFEPEVDELNPEDLYYEEVRSEDDNYADTHPWVHAVYRGLGALALVALTAGASQAANLEGVGQLQMTVDGGILRTFCTAFAVDVKGTTTWVSAAHCLQGNKQLYINREPVYPDRQNDTLDIVVFRSGPKVKHAFPLLHSDLNLREKIWTAGYPNGAVDLHLSEGIVNGTTESGHALYGGFAIAPGASGSPVFNDKNEVVGIMLLSECKTGYCPFSRGATSKNLYDFVMQNSKH